MGQAPGRDSSGFGADGQIRNPKFMTKAGSRFPEGSESVFANYDVHQSNVLLALVGGAGYDVYQLTSSLDNSNCEW